MYSFSSFFSRFQNFGQAKADVADAKENSTTATQEKPYTYTTRSKGFANLGNNDKWGRYTKEEQQAVHSRNGTRTNIPDTFITPDRSPTLVNNYTQNVIGRKIDYSKTRAYKRAYAGYSTGTMFSSGISRIGSLTSLYNSAINNPFGYNNNQYGGSRWT